LNKITPNKIEPSIAFPYKAPTEEVKRKYKHIFQMQDEIKPRLLKVFFDKIIACTLLTASAPIILLLKFAYLIEGILITENKGPLFFYYWAISGGRRIKKWKLRIIKTKYIDHEKAANHEWIAYSAEWTPKTRTYVSAFIKKWYLDEIPQFWSVLIGDMSIVGPRPLSELHYKRDIEQGNISRKLIKGGLLGLGHINKGTAEMGNSIYEYEYINEYINRSSFGILKLDLWVIWRGILVIFRGGGH